MPRSILPVLFLIPQILPAQQHCGTDEIRQRHFGAPGQADARTFIDRLGARAGNDRDEIHTVPLVFHVVHDGVLPAPTDADILQAVEEANLRFANMAPWQSSTGHAVNIQFCLASVDPTGAPTTGITRTQSDLAWHSSIQESDLKSLIRWDPHLYINVWIVADILDPNIGGYAWYPQYAGSALDGVVMEQAWLLNNSVLVHELGHALGLYHTFDQFFFEGCENGNCLLNGDQICDTPPDISQFGCMENSCSTDAADTTGLGPFTSDVPELPNYMDYTSCPESFTQGQADRMYDVLETMRWTLLQSNGCGNNPGAPEPVYSYSIDSTLCTGTIAITNTSANVLFTQWDVDGGSLDATGPTFTHTFQSTDLYTVRMMTSGFGGGDTVSIDVFVRVPPWPEYPIWSGFEDIAMDPVLLEPLACLGTTITLQGAPGMASYLWSNGSTEPSIQFTVDSAFSYQLTAIDANGLPWTNCAAVHADVRPPYDLHSFENIDTVLCNGFVPLLLWTPPYYPTANNVWYHNGSPTATNTFSHTYQAVPPGDNSFWVANTDPNGCTLLTDTFHVYNQGLPPIYLYEQGNVLTPNYGCSTTPQWTLDGQPYPSNSNIIIDPEPGCYQMTCVDCVTIVSDVYCILPTGVETPDRPAITIHPSPVQDRLMLSRDLHRDALVHITDAAGRTIHHGGVTGRSIDVGTYAPGIYLLVVKEDGVRQVVRWVKE